MEYMKTGRRKNESLLSNVFNYEVGMMTEKIHLPKKIVTTIELINQYEKEDNLLKENVNPLLISGANRIRNYNLGMMKVQVKQKKPRIKPLVIQSTARREKMKQSVLNPKQPEHRRKTAVPPSTPEMMSDHLQKPKTRSPLSPLSPNILPHFNQITSTQKIKHSAVNKKQQSMFAAAPRITPESPLSEISPKTPVPLTSEY